MEKLKTNYFAISATDNNNLNIGVAVASSFEELRDKINTIVSRNFDAQAKFNGFHVDQYGAVLAGDEATFRVLVLEDGEDADYLITAVLTSLT